MASRAIGAFCALAAATLFVVSLATSAWWAGHPIVNGKSWTAKDVHVGLLGATGCNTGGDGTCEPIEIGEVIRFATYGELAAVALAVLFALALAVSAWKVGDRRRGLSTASALFTLLAAGGCAAVMLLGPDITAAQRVDVPIGWGLYVFGGGVLASFLASAVTRNIEREPLRLKTSPPVGAQPPVDVLQMLQGEGLRPSGPRLATPQGMDAMQARDSAPMFEAAPQLRPLYDPMNAGVIPSPEQPQLPRNMPTPMPRAAIGALTGLPTPPPMMAEPSPPPMMQPPSVPLMQSPAPPSAPPMRERPPSASPPMRERPPSASPPMRGKPQSASPPLRDKPLPSLPGMPPNPADVGDHRSVVPPSKAKPAPAPAKPIAKRKRADSEPIEPPRPASTTRPQTPSPGARPSNPALGSQPKRVPLPARSTQPPPMRPSAPTLAHAVPPMPTVDNLPAPGVLPAPGSSRATTEADDHLETAMRPTESITAVEINAEAKAAAQQRISGPRTSIVEAQVGETTDVGVVPPSPMSTGEERVVTDQQQAAPAAIDADVTDQTRQPSAEMERDAKLDLMETMERNSKTPVPTIAARAQAAPAETPVPTIAARAPAQVPVSTAPTSLPPPKVTESIPSGPTPACPQCESPMAWVEEHLRFYCKQCRMYF